MDDEMNFEELKEGEYFVRSHMKIDINPRLFDTEENRCYLTFYMQDLLVKTKVTDYDAPNYHLLGVAKRVRNYASLICKKRIPLEFQIVGKMPDVGFPMFPEHTIYDGTTGLPLTGARYGDKSFFLSGLGPKNGLKPPYDVIQTYDKLIEWLREINNNLKLTQNVLDLVDEESSLDHAIRSLGNSIWMDGVEEQLACRWRTLESITKIDFPETQFINFDQIFESIHKRLDTNLTKEQFDIYRKFRNLSTHGIPPLEISRSVHQTADMLWLFASKMIKSELKTKGIFLDDS